MLSKSMNRLTTMRRLRAMEALYKRVASLVGSPGRIAACWRRPIGNTSLVPGNRRVHIINSDYAVDYLTPPAPSLWRTLATHGRYPAEQGNNVSLPLTAGLFQHATNLHADCIGRNAIVAGQIFHGFPGSKAAGDAGFGRGKVEQRHYEFYRRRSWSGDRQENQHGGAARKDITRGKPDRHNMRDHQSICNLVSNRERADTVVVVHYDPGQRLGKHGIGLLVLQRHLVGRA